MSMKLCATTRPRSKRCNLILFIDEDFKHKNGARTQYHQRIFACVIEIAFIYVFFALTGNMSSYISTQMYYLQSKL